MSATAIEVGQKVEWPPGGHGGWGRDRVDTATVKRIGPTVAIVELTRWDGTVKRIAVNPGRLSSS